MYAKNRVSSATFVGFILGVDSWLTILAFCAVYVHEVAACINNNELFLGRIAKEHLNVVGLTVLLRDELYFLVG